MLKKIKIILVIASLSVTLCLMSNTYSRYVASSQNNINAAFAKWQILINNSDITTNSTSNVTFEPTVEANSNVAEGKVAPSSKGYFDIEVDPTNVDVSFKYKINLEIQNKNIPDLMITKYAILSSTYKDGDAINYTYLNNYTIENTMNYNNKAFEKFTIRVYFEWYEGDKESMNDTADTQVGNSAATNDTTFTINANINFEQAL